MDRIWKLNPLLPDKQTQDLKTRIQFLEEENANLRRENLRLKEKIDRSKEIIMQPRVSQTPSSTMNSQQSNTTRQKDVTAQCQDTSRKKNTTDSIMLIGDSILKHIDPKKISQKQVVKKTFPGKKIEEIKTELFTSSAPTGSSKPSHIIIHVGTNNIPTDSVDECTAKLLDLARSAKEKYPDTKIGVSGITFREDIDVTSKNTEINRRVEAAS